MDNIISTGLSDTQVYLQNAANLKAPFNYTKESGQYPAFGDVMVNRRVASMWQILHLDARIFVDGLGVTSMSAEAEDAAGVRIPFLAPPPRRMRTLGITACANDEPGGTPGNSGPFNKNLPNAMQTNAVDIWFNQLYDEAAQISRDQMRMIGNNLDILGQYTANIPQVTAMLMDAEIMATQIGSALGYARRIGQKNILPYNSKTDARGYMQGIMNSLGTSLSNVRGAYAEGITSYPVEKSVYVLRYKAFNKLMTIDNGAIINSDIGQKILLNGKFDDSGTRYLGGAIMGMYRGIIIKVVPDEYWDMAAGLLNLTPAEKAQFDKIDGYICNGIGTYFGRASVVTDVDKSPTTSIGMIIRNDWRWGTRVTRNSSITLLVDSENDLADWTNPITAFKGVISPNDLEAVLDTYNDTDYVNGEGTLQRVGIGTTTLITDVKLTLTGTDSASVKNATLTVMGEDGITYSFGNNGNGTYNFVLPRGTAATVTITAPDYNTATLNVTESDTALATKEFTQALTAPAAPAKAAAKSAKPAQASDE